jgi:4-hydroxybenzoate polyprenyltransferase
MSTYYREYRCENCGERMGLREDRCPMCGEYQSIRRVETESRFYNLNPTIEVLCAFALAVVGMLVVKLWNELGWLLLFLGVPLLSSLMIRNYLSLSRYGPDAPEAHAAASFRRGLLVLLIGLIVAIVVIAFLVAVRDPEIRPLDPIFPL